MGIRDLWVAYQFDCAVCSVGIALENASQERINEGSDEEPKWVNKYTLKQLLDPAFRFEAEDNWMSEDEIAHIDGILYDEVG